MDMDPFHLFDFCSSSYDETSAAKSSRVAIEDKVQIEKSPFGANVRNYRSY